MRRRWRRSTLALALASAAIVAAAATALLPADQLHTHYSWPAQELPAAQPQRLWYTPLLLSRHEPQSLAAELPCTASEPLPGADRSFVVLATARDAPAAGGLSVTQAGRTLVVSIGHSTLIRLELAARPSNAGDCAYRLLLAHGGWSVEGGPRSVSEAGPTAMPVVDGLFSNVHLRAGKPPTVEITSTVHGSRSTAVQAVVRALGAIAGLAALLLVALPQRPRRLAWVRGEAARRIVARLALLDLVVVLALLIWWVIGPAFFDDGWVTASQKNFAATGNLSSYYDSFAVTSSLQYWLVWAEHWLFDSTSALLLLRVPALLCLTATWVLCRWIFSRASAAPGRAARWTLATAFLAGAFAWGMTLRPEPVVALLVTGVVACAVRFVEKETAAPLAIAAVLTALAVSAHPAGLVALAPLVVVSPALLRWARPRIAVVATIVLAAVALLGILALLGSDLAHLRESVISLRTFGQETAGWRDELTRYSLLSRDLYGAPLRRAWVVLALLAVLAYLLRRRSSSVRLLDFFAAALGIALVLLIATPAKLPWHFGTLIGLAAIALAAETARLSEDAGRTRGWHVRPFLFVGAAMLAAAWAWFPRNTWSDLDLRTLDWTLGIERRLTFAKAAGAVPLALLLGLALLELVRRRARRVRDVPWRAAAWTVPVVVVPLIVFTIAVLVADARKTSSWTLTRQNVDTLAGNLGCGLADDAVVAQWRSMHGLAVVSPAALPAPSSWLPPAPGGGLPRFELTQDATRTPWFRLPSGRHVGFYLTGLPASPTGLQLDWGRLQGTGVAHVASAGVPVDFASDARPELGYWRFYASGDLPPAPSTANAVRLSLATGGAPSAGIGVTAPVTYTNEPLARTLERDRPALALPNLLTYVPCIEQPRVAAIADVPRSIVAFRDAMWPVGTGTSPFDLASEIYRLVRLPLSDSRDPPGDVALYVVDTHIAGAAVAPPVTEPAD